MISHWLTVAWRTVLKDPVFAAISILSLAIGCAGALLVGAYEREELTFDWWLPASERMVRLDTTLVFTGLEPRLQAGAPSGLAPLLLDAAPGVEAITRSMTNRIQNVRVGETSRDLFGIFADPNFFQVIELPFAEGDPSTALADPSGVVLSQQTREQLFGKESALGRTIAIGDDEVVVTGVLARLPRDTSITQLGFVAPFASPVRDRTYLPDVDAYFTFANTATYLRAESPAAARAWRGALPALAEGLMAGRREAGQPEMSFVVTPFRDMRFAPATGVSGARERLALMAVVAAALLLVSAFNYVSLSLARLVGRTREVGLRKAMGADRGHLLRQHLAESVTFTAAALLLGFGLAEAVRPWFVRTMSLQMEAGALHHPAFLALALAGAAALALLVAAYPAAFLAGVKPATILQGRSGSTRALAAAIFALAAVQFAAATALVTSVAVFHAQAAYLQSAPLGYETKDRYFVAAATITISSGLGRPPPEQAQANMAKLSRLRASLAREPGVLSVSGTAIPVLLGIAGAFFDSSMVPVAPLGEEPADGARAMPIPVDLDYLSEIGAHLLAGRLFDDDLGTDRVFLEDPGADPAVTPVVITRESLPLVGARTPADAVGRHARVIPSTNTPGKEIEVVGVTDSFYFRSLRFPASSVVFFPSPGAATSFLVRVDPARRGEAAAAMREAMTEIAPGGPPRVIDLGQLAEDQYTEERRWRRLVTGAAVLSVGVACLGLYGLTAFSAGQRRREVGVRKSLGADQGQVLGLMLARFARPVAAGIVVGWGIAFYAMAEWLSGFAHRTALGPLPFAIAGAAALAVAAATALWHALRAARTSPAVVLRTE